jgi:hypothetical protein
MQLRGEKPDTSHDLEVFVSCKNYRYALRSYARMKQHEIVKCLF